MKKITLSLNLSHNLFHHSFRPLGAMYGKITNNVLWELEHFWDLDNIALFKFEHKSECKYAGLELSFALIGYNVSFRTYKMQY